MPLPPPPPPGPPPPPTFAPVPLAAAEGRNLLLQSIRQGTSLKKTVTNDKSAPVIQSAVRPSSNGGGSPRGNGGIIGSATLGRNNALAGLFTQGMPRLKPTGVDIGQNNSQSLTSLPSATASGKQEQTRRQFNVDIKNRGPPPKPPPANLKPTMPQDDIIVGMKTNFKPFIQSESYSSERLWSPNSSQSKYKAPISPRPMRLNTTFNAGNKYPAYNYSSLSPSPLQDKKLLSTYKSSPNIPSSCQPSPKSSPTFKFPFYSKEDSDGYNTFSVQIPSKENLSNSTRSYKTLPKHQKLNDLGVIVTKDVFKTPPQSPNRNEYNKYRNSSTSNPSSPNKSVYRPLPETMTLLKLSKPSEFKIQRPKVSQTETQRKSEQTSMSTSDSVLTGPLHNRSSSTTSLNNNSWTQPLPKAPPGGYGKPNVAPKPPGISPGKLVNGRPSVTRAQSMRAPRSPPVAPPQGQVPLLPNHSELHRGAPVFHQSQDSILHTPPPPKHNTLPSPRTAPPNRPPLRPPQTRPPPPPPNRVVMSSPPCPPPPPPTQAPPPPPHRVPLQNHRTPPVTPMHLSTVPPPPPARHSSVRNGGIHQTFSSKLEARFIEKFHVKEEFPPPQPFLGLNKVYNSKTAKQPAPQPPQHLQLHWPRDNSSTC